MRDYTNEHWKVAGTAVTFGKFYKGSIERLEAAGCEVKLNPYGRPLTNEEMIEFAVKYNIIADIELVLME